MDKRTLIFVIVLACVFLGLNLFFSYQRDQRNREYLQQKELKKAKARQALEAELKTRLAPLTSFPLHTVDGHEVMALDQHVITLAWQENMPDQITVGGRSYSLLTKHPVKGGPAVYGSLPFQLAALAEDGSYDLQLITFRSEHVYLAEYEDESFKLLNGPLKENAIAFYKAPSGNWQPFGFFEAKGQLFVPLKTLPLFAPFTPKEVHTPKESDQKYYVLENAYQQIVFTNIGGAISEINLPFASDEDRYSVVNQIGFDRDLVKDSPENARFPLHPYYTPDKETVNAEGKLGGYYPLLRRDILGAKGHHLPAEYTAFNLVSEYPEMAELPYQVKEFSKDHIVFEAKQPHRKITKTYRLKPTDTSAPYSFDLTLKIEGDSRSLWLTSGIPEVEIMSKASSPQIQYMLHRKGKSEMQKLALPKVGEENSMSSIHPEWVVISNGYLGVIMDPLREIGSGFKARGIAGTAVPTRLSLLDPKYQPYPPAKYPGYQLLLPIPKKGGTYSFHFFGGPFEEGVLKAVDKAYKDPESGTTPNYIACRTFYGWFSFISKPFAKLLFVVMKFFHTITGSWGFSIILLTVFLRLLLYPLNAWSFKSMRRMQKLAPQVKAIQNKHKKEPKKAQIEIMALYREKKVNPFMGCIPILIQLPFLIAMFDLLKSSFQLRGASFIPGWITNLTAPDVLFSWQTPIFFFGTQFHLLPILLGVVMFIQQRLAAGAQIKKGEELTDQQRQQKAMGTIMTVVFTVMFYNFPSGLNLYWLSSMILGILQQWLTNRWLDKHGDTKVEVIAPKKGRKTKKF